MCLQCELRIVRTRVDTIIPATFRILSTEELFNDELYLNSLDVINYHIYPFEQYVFVTRIPNKSNRSIISLKNNDNAFLKIPKNINQKTLKNHAVRNKEKKDEAVHFTQKELQELIKKDVNVIRERLSSSKFHEEIAIDERYLTITLNPFQRNCTAFKNLIFDLNKEILNESVQRQTPHSVKTSNLIQKKKRILVAKTSQDDQLVSSTRTQHLSFKSNKGNPSRGSSNLTCLRKRQQTDDIVLQELHEEESEWTNYDQEEISIKFQLTNSVFNLLINDTVELLKSMQSKKAAQ